MADIADRVCAARVLLRLGLSGEHELEKCAKYAFRIVDILLNDLDAELSGGVRQ
jgi:hypothetical protein